MASFYGWGSTASRLEPLRGGSLLYVNSKQTLCIDIVRCQDVKTNVEMLFQIYIYLYIYNSEFHTAWTTF